MLNHSSPNQEQFYNLLDRIRDEVASREDEIRELKKENKQLKSKLEEIQNGQTDIYSAMTETERMALRHQVLGLIKKIDSHLEEEE
ncbi:MAG: hypothetical protein R3211_04130 [Balneolaceae bacterium]|nr:hypothetical protein [Balneolaceae bacterium]